ncbi:hypothetical protein VTL71DRAFT_4943 [Oculimacula yallundae]|uniref:Uncharacterized protein n=1 Tax=Oculimacula yallundae TaxID=86028 RepID=A0ABR4C3G1_9HELO
MDTPFIEQPCELAKRYLNNNEVLPVSNLMPRPSPLWYIPRSRINALLAEGAAGVTLEALFFCPCRHCERDGGAPSDRSPYYNELREEELKSEYATIFALLIHVRRPGLIRLFQRYELKLLETRYLQEEDFRALVKEGIFDFDSLKKMVLREQHSFHVRVLKPSSDVKVISDKELLPIKEDPVAKGEGSFAVVHCFEFQDDEYRSKEFGQITRFARKVFKIAGARSSAKEWYNLQSLAKATKHQHLMSALSAYWHGEIFFILQEEADLSLHDYLSKGQGDEFESFELWKQVQGLAHGLTALHTVYQGTKIAYHQDLKPANILIVKRIFKIADFGLLEFKPVLPENSGSTGVVSSHNTGYYAPPRHGQYTRQDDIWSFACIFSELATADIQGRKEVLEYKECRISSGPAGRDTAAFFLGKRVKIQVLDRHRQLQREAQGDASQDRVADPFRRSFYSTKFFELLNSMFRHDSTARTHLEIPSQVKVPDARKVAEVLEQLSKDANPCHSFNDQSSAAGSLSQSALINVESLVKSLDDILVKFQDGLISQQRRQFQHTNLAKLKQSICDLQDKQCLQRRQQGLKRLEPFLERFEQFEQMLNKFCEAAAFTAFIWGPVSYLFNLTDDYPEAFREVLDTYARVGQNQPTYSQYEELLRTRSNISRAITAAYFEIMQVQTILLRVFTQRCWRDIFTTIWPHHKSRISAHIANMEARLDLITHGGNMTQIDTVLEKSPLIDDPGPSEADPEGLRRAQTVYIWLKCVDMESDQDHFRRIRSHCPPDTSPGQWLLVHTTFKEWFDPQFTALPTLLWLHGNPGVGKSVLASVVIDEARKLLSTPTVLFFYFRQGDTERDNFTSMARTLLAQLVKNNTAILDYMYTACCKSGEPFLNSRSTTESLIKFALNNCNSAYIVLDGLDECCSREERKVIVTFFRSLIENHDDDATDRLRCLFISRKDNARKDFNGMFQIEVDLESNEDDIEAFSQYRSQELGEELDIPKEKLKQIAATVSACADGMFLVAELVWINLCGQTSIADLEDELAVLPKGLERLDEVYRRIINKINAKPKKARDEARRLLGWIVCAKRPLKSHEVQTMKSVNLEEGEIAFDRQRFRVDLKDLCESLIDVRADGSIELIHLTAKYYLLKEEFSGASEDMSLAHLCIDYLHLSIFDGPFTTHSVLEGSYGFMEYAVLNWVRHLEAGLSSESESDESTEELLESFETLLERHWRQPTIEPRVLKRIRDRLQVFNASPMHKEMEQAVVSTQDMIKRFGDVRPAECALDFFEVVGGIREQLELVVTHGAIDSNQQTIESFEDDMELKYGANLFKCPRFSCRYFTDGFASKKERERHIQRHERPFRCSDIHCTSFGFAKEEQLARHLKETHSASREEEQSFPTEDEVIESQKEYVPEPEPVEEEIPAAVPEVVSQAIPASVIPDPDLIINRAAKQAPISKPARHTKEKPIFNCSHCPKTFGKRFNRDSHLKSHGIGHTLACPTCGKLFSRQSDLTRHEKTHTTGKSFQCGGVLSSGKQWGCGQSFGRKDILSNHHKSKKGKVCLAARAEAGWVEEDEEMEEDDYAEDEYAEYQGNLV